MGGMDNKTAKQVSNARKNAIRKMSNKYAGCYEDYLADPQAQFKMPYVKYKKIWLAKRRKEKTK